MKLFEVRLDGIILTFYHPKIGQSMSVKDAKKLFKGAVHWLRKVVKQAKFSENFDLEKWKVKEMRTIMKRDGFIECKFESTILWYEN